jgi:dTDP-4-dehydrorhamnose reductase
LRYLIVGAGGQLGEKVGQIAKLRGHYVIAGFKTRAPETNFPETIILDKTKKDDVERTISKLKPDVVVDTAALHNVDYCESHLDEAMSVNRDGTANLALASSKSHAKFIFISTDFVFDGEGAPYSEQLIPRPLSVYAKSKLEGEEATLSLNRNSVVCRPSVIYSWVKLSKIQLSDSSSGKPLNFGAWLVSQLEAKKDVRIVTDQITSPTLADDLAGAILKIAESTATGIFHTAGATPLSRYDFSVRLAKRLDLEKNLIHPIESSQLRQLAKRPMNSSLLSERIKRELGYSMMDIDQALDMFAAESKAAELVTP